VSPLCRFRLLSLSLARRADDELPFGNDADLMLRAFAVPCWARTASSCSKVTDISLSPSGGREDEWSELTVISGGGWMGARI
jgi:hypothetical protein